MDVRKTTTNMELNRFIEILAREVKKKLLDVTWMSKERLFSLVSDNLAKTIEAEITGMLDNAKFWFSACQLDILRQIDFSKDETKKQYEQLLGKLQVSNNQLFNDTPVPTPMVECTGFIKRYIEDFDFHLPKNLDDHLRNIVTKDKLKGDVKARQLHLITEFFKFLAHQANDEQLRTLQKEALLPCTERLLSLPSPVLPLFTPKNCQRFYENYKVELDVLNVRNTLTTVKDLHELLNPCEAQPAPMKRI